MSTPVTTPADQLHDALRQVLLRMARLEDELAGARRRGAWRPTSSCRPVPPTTLPDRTPRASCTVGTTWSPRCTPPLRLARAAANRPIVY